VTFSRYSCQSIDESDIEAVVNALRSEYLTQGPLVERFESELAKYCGTKSCRAVANGTLALYAACHALGVQCGDRVWTSPLSFVASANCARYLGATVDFVDVDPSDGNIYVAELEKKLRSAAAHTLLPKVIIPVHFTGRLCDMPAIRKLAEQYGVKVIEDCAHALGAVHADGTRAGSCKYADASVLSFHPVKSITTGEGGAVLTDDPEIASAARIFSVHGITRDPAVLKNDLRPDYYYEQQELGFNFRITDIQAALGVSQLKRIDQFIARRRELARRYRRLLEQMPVILPPNDERSAWHLYVIRVADSSKRDAVYEALRKSKIGVNVHYLPIHLQPYYQKLGFVEGAFPAAESFSAASISLPLHQKLTEHDQDFVVERLRAALQ
jgi:UDP-4-amino-4,6-dideoxy-N-acetyl-beta-L-altrosamine transaminase